jgi:hypothetical protein
LGVAEREDDMSIGPESLAADLRALSYDVEDIVGGVRVLLPLSCSVTIECERDRLRLVPRFGYFARRGSISVDSVTFVLSVGLAVMAVTHGGTSAFAAEFAPGVALYAACSLVALLGDVARYVLTESAIAAVRSLLIIKGTAQPAAAAVRGHA